jgi:transposase InsO family protein
MFYQRILHKMGLSDERQKKYRVHFETVRKGMEGKYDILMPKTVYQADLMVMPFDNNYKYLLTIIDVATGKADAQPIVSKSSGTIKRAFDVIFGRGIIQPKMLYLDRGSEFWNEEVQQYMKSKDIIMRDTRVGRKNQNAVIENFNGVVGKVLMGVQSVKEIETGKRNKKWSADVPKLIEGYNEEKDKHKEPTIQQKLIDENTKPIKELAKENILKEGTKVYLIEEYAKDVITKKRLHGKFRHGDLRYSTIIHEISKTVMNPNQPIRYMIKGIKNASFLRHEIKLA